MRLTNLDPWIAQVLLYYIVVGFVMNLTGILMVMQNYTVKVDVIKFIISVALWPFYLFKLIEGANKP